MSLRVPRTVLMVVAALAASLLAGCSTGPTESRQAAGTPAAGTSAEPGAFPVTVEHAFGETTIEEPPRRVATLGWSDQDMALSLGVVPVGATKMTWGGNGQGSTDWFDAELARVGADQPVRYDDTDGAPVEEIAKLAPDLILATNSGITQKEYVKLSKIAPVVAYPDAPWVTPWQTSLEMVGQALGRTDEAARVAEQTDQVVAEAKRQYPALQGTSLVFGFLTTADLSTIGIYGAEDNRVRTLEAFGMTSPPIVGEVVPDGKFYGTLSAERASSVKSDVLLTYAEDESDLETFADDPLLGEIPALADGHAFAEADKQVGLAITNPSPLSMPYIVEHFLPHVAEAAAGA